MTIKSLFKARRYNKNGTYKYSYYLIKELNIENNYIKIHKKRLSKDKYNFLKKDLENFQLFKNKEDFIILGNDSCEYCLKAKNLLKKNKIKFSYMRKNGSDILNKIIDEYKYIPIIFYKTVFIGGYEELSHFIKYYKKDNLIYFNDKDKKVIDKILKKN
jgi:glutaredoxin